MTEERPRCRECGSVSNDPDWCDVCGSELAQPAPAAAWLAVGDTFRVALTRDAILPTRAAGVEVERAFDDTLPPGLSTAALLAPDQTNPFGTRPTEQQTPVVVPAAATPDSQVVETLSLTLQTLIASLAHKRIWRAVSKDGRAFRVEERATPSREAIPDGVHTLAWLVDVPLGVARHGEHELKVYREVAGVTMFERLEAMDTPLTPTEVVEWLRPVIRAMREIHTAGFLCLRLCPYTVKYARDGRVFLQNVELLYPQDTALPTLPAISGYTAPEIYEASVGTPPDLRADLFSVGMMAYFLITRSDPPTSIYTNYRPAISARDRVPEFPLGFSPVLETLSAYRVEDRPKDGADALEQLEHARDRAVQQVRGLDHCPIGVAADTHVGIVKRLHTAENQDSVFTAVDERATTALVVVADGVSTATYGSGDVASQLTVAAFEDAWRRLLENPSAALHEGPGAWLRRAFEDANARCIAYINTRYGPFDTEPAEVMGSTCVAALIHDGRVTLGSLGDSRAYLVGERTIERITRDHNIFTLAIAEGLEADVAATLPQADALARCIGTYEFADDGLLVSDPLEPDLYAFSLHDGDRLLLCTDGLTDYAADSTEATECAIGDIVRSEELPELACLSLVALANRGGGGDNIGVAIAVARPRWSGAYEWFAEQRQLEHDGAESLSLDLEALVQAAQGAHRDDDDA